MTTLRGIPIDGERPIKPFPVRNAMELRALALVRPEEHQALTETVHWPFPEAEGPALCGMPLGLGVTFAGVNDQSAVTCSDCLEWMRS